MNKAEVIVEPLESITTAEDLAPTVAIAEQPVHQNWQVLVERSGQPKMEVEACEGFAASLSLLTNLYVEWLFRSDPDHISPISNTTNPY